MRVYLLYGEDGLVPEGYVVQGEGEHVFPPTYAGYEAAHRQAAEMNARIRADREEEGKRTARVPRARTTGKSPSGRARARRALWTERYGANTNSNTQGTNDVSRGQD